MPRKSRKYGLFRRPRNAASTARWEQASSLLMPKEAAVSHWQNILISAALNASAPEYRLRPVPTKKIKVHGAIG